MTYYFLTASKEYSFDGVNWFSAIAPFTTRSGNSVTFNPQNGHSAFTMFPASDSMNIDTVLRAPNYFTPVQLVTTIITVFPKANIISGVSVSSLDDVPQGASQKWLTAEQLIWLQNMIAVDNPNNI